MAARPRVVPVNERGAVRSMGQIRTESEELERRQQRRHDPEKDEI